METYVPYQRSHSVCYLLHLQIANNLILRFSLCLPRHPVQVTFPPFLQPIKTSTQLGDPEVMQADVVGVVTYRGGVPVQSHGRSYHRVLGACTSPSVV